MERLGAAMMAHMTTVEGDVLWEPSEELRRDAAMTAFLAHVAASTGRTFADYEAAWRWSVDEPEAFWRAVVEYFDLPIRDVPTSLLADASMPGARWFEGATLNYAEAVFARAAPDRPALLAASERRPAARRSRGTSCAAVGRGRGGGSAAARRRSRRPGRGHRPEHPRGGHRAARDGEPRRDLVELRARSSARRASSTAWPRSSRRS